MQQAADGYQETKDSCVSWSPQQVTHVFYHSLIVDPSKAFDGDYKADGYNQMMTTMKEFNQITQTMYDRGYVMVSIYDLAQMDENGVMTAKEILLPEGKTPFVLSQDGQCRIAFLFAGFILSCCLWKIRHSIGDGKAIRHAARILAYIHSQGKRVHSFLRLHGSTST